MYLGTLTTKETLIDMKTLTGLGCPESMDSYLLVLLYPPPLPAYCCGGGKFEVSDITVAAAGTVGRLPDLSAGGGCTTWDLEP